LGEKVGTVLGRRAEAGFISGGEQISLRAARRRWWRIRAGRGGRQASLCIQVVLVVEKQLVIHLQIQRQKADIGFKLDGGVPDSSTIQENWGQERTGQGETKAGGKAHPGGGEAANRDQGSVREGVPSREVGPWVEGGGENKA